MGTLFLTSMAALAVARESAGDDLWEPTSLSRIHSLPSPEPELFALPTTLSGEPSAEDSPASFSIGPAAGYLRVRGAERGTWFGGVQARLHFAKIFAAEAAITFHQNRYDNNDVVVTQYPLQLTAFLYIIPEGPIRPYILGGVGWYYTRVDYRGPFATLYDDRTEHIFGEHLGVGGELMLGPRVSADIDARYIFLNATNDKVIHRDFNYWQVTFGVNFYF
jgi:opacity protein-like surface antigen